MSNIIETEARKMRKLSHIVSQGDKSSDLLLEEIVKEESRKHREKYGDVLYRNQSKIQEHKQSAENKPFGFSVTKDEILDNFRNRFKNYSRDKLLNAHARLFN